MNQSESDNMAIPADTDVPAAEASALRSPEPPPRTLIEEACQWLTRLPDEVRPRQAAERFPHVVNRLARLWKAPRQLDSYFDELMVDQRGGRRGFPLGVLMEVANLREYYQTSVYPLRSCIWDGQS